MKVILTGSTGFIGSEVLSQCLSSPSITSIIVLSRRLLPAQITDKNPKLEVVIMEDFLVYSKDTLAKLEGADACIWSMGTTAALPNLEIDYPLAFMKEFGTIVTKSGKKFKYLHCSGILATRDQEKKLWFLEEGRKIKGRAEEEVINFAKKVKPDGNWVSFVVKPAMVLPKDGGIVGAFRRFSAFATGGIRVDELAASMIDIVESGEAKQITANEELVSRGRRVLQRT